jgi:hypothetical protein
MPCIFRASRTPGRHGTGGEGRGPRGEGRGVRGHGCGHGCGYACSPPPARFMKGPLRLRQSGSPSLATTWSRGRGVQTATLFAPTFRGSFTKGGCDVFPLSWDLVAREREPPAFARPAPYVSEAKRAPARRDGKSNLLRTACWQGAAVGLATSSRRDRRKNRTPSMRRPPSQSIPPSKPIP